MNSINLVEQFYDQDAHQEWERLNRHRIEFAVMMRAFREFLPAAPAQILDVGGGPGRYAIALAQQGYQVTLLDLSQASLRRAAHYAEAAGVRLAGIQQQNALKLAAVFDATYDVVLLLGPLYHLLTEAERSQAVQEAYRVLKPQGRIFVAFLTRFAALRICAERFPMWLFENQAYAERLLTSGIHQGEWGFTMAYYAHPSEVEPFMAAQGFATLQLVGCEGVVAQAETQINTLTGEAWEWWADLNYHLGKDSALYGAAIHLLYIGQKMN